MFLTDLRRTAVLGLAFVFFATLMGCGKTDTGPAATKPPAVNPAPTGAGGDKPGPTGAGDKKTETDLTKVKPDFTLTAEEYLDEYKKDAMAAEMKYDGKVVELSGTVGQLLLGGSDRPMLGLAAGKSLTEMLQGVTCTLVDKNPWAKAPPGQTVKVRGKWPAFAAGAALIDCVIVDFGPNPAIVIAAPELAKEYQDNREKAEAKYNNKTLILEGEVLEKQLGDKLTGEMYLKGTDKVKVYCIFHLGDSDKTMLNSVKPGQRVKLNGQFFGLASSADKIVINSVLLIPASK